MSDVLIRGMEMPKDGCHHMVCIYADGTVSTGGRVYMAVPVPPHGRLIDADALMDQIEHDTPLSAVFEKTMRRYLHNAPTIIPAEECE